MEELHSQNEHWTTTPKRKAHLRALSTESVAVVTGQQVGLFLGPAFTWLKAMTAIHVAEHLQQESGVPCVPIFWVQSEDHDFDEIRSTTLADCTGNLTTLSLNQRQNGVAHRASLAHVTFDQGISDTLRRFVDLITPCDHGEQTEGLLSPAYRPGGSLETAFAETIGRCFAEEGLLTFCVRRAGPMRALSPIFERCFAEHETITGRLRERAMELQDHELPIQVPIRKGCPLPFFHSQGRPGDRYRLQHTPAGFEHPQLSDALSSEEIHQALASDPLCVSSSALLRPVLQDILFPTAAYVGGPSELRYFAQVGPLYDHFDVPMPMIVPRAHATFTDGLQERRRNRFGVTLDDLERPEKDLLHRVQCADLGTEGWSEAERELQQHVDRFHQTLSPQAQDISAHLAKSLNKTRHNIDRALRRLRTHLVKQSLHRRPDLLRELRACHRWYYPEGKPQERMMNTLGLVSRYGNANMKQTFQERYTPFRGDLLTLRF